MNVIRVCSLRIRVWMCCCLLGLFIFTNVTLLSFPGFHRLVETANWVYCLLERKEEEFRKEEEKLSKNCMAAPTDRISADSNKRKVFN